MATRESHESIRGVSLFVRRIGSGPPTVVLHGGPGAHHDYLLPGFDALAVGRELIYYDQRGGGRSPVPRDVPVGWTEQVADLEALRERWSLDRLTLAGYSWGALLALLYALEHPERVERLALVSPAPAWRAARESYEARFSQRNLDPAFQDERRRLRESGLRERDPAAFQQRIFELSVAAYFHDPVLGDYDLRPALPRLRGIPAIVLHGEDDPIPLQTAQVTADLIGAPLHPLPDCGHVPYVEARDEFVRVAGDFLGA